MGIAERWNRFEPLPQDMEPALQRLSALLEREGVLLAYLFGSTSKGRPGHDVDLAILTRDGPAFRLREAICQCLGTERLDLVDLRRASPMLRFEIIRNGRALHRSSQELQDRFELQTLRVYRDTAHLRQQQRDYLKRRMAQ